MLALATVRVLVIMLNEILLCDIHELRVRILLLRRLILHLLLVVPANLWRSITRTQMLHLLSELSRSPAHQSRITIIRRMYGLRHINLIVVRTVIKILECIFPHAVIQRIKNNI